MPYTKYHILFVHNTPTIYLHLLGQKKWRQMGGSSSVAEENWRHNFTPTFAQNNLPSQSCTTNLARQCRLKF